MANKGNTEARRVVGGIPRVQTYGLLGSAVHDDTPRNITCAVPNANAHHTTLPNTIANCTLFIAWDTDGNDAIPVMINKLVLKTAVNIEASSSQFIVPLFPRNIKPKYSLPNVSSVMQAWRKRK